MFASLAVAEEPPVFLDWLPWHHALGGVLNLGRSVLLGATHYIDDGKPLPGMFERTVRNLREVSPTVLTSVPSAWSMLAVELERDPQLAKSVFARVINFGYGGASLPKDVNERIQRVAERTVGERIVFATGLAATETTGVGTYRTWASDDLGNIGAPAPGTELKLVPLEGDRFEIRVRGAHNFAGYVARPDLTEAAFDDEGFFKLGDAVRLVDRADPTQGMRFDGRVAEDFKLVNGTWVRTGSVRLGLIERCAPLITDAVICGHDQTYVAALAWPNVATCQRLLPELAGLGAAELATHPLLVATLRQRLREDAASASLRVERLLLMAEPSNASGTAPATSKGMAPWPGNCTKGQAALHLGLMDNSPQRFHSRKNAPRPSPASVLPPMSCLRHRAVRQEPSPGAAMAKRESPNRSGN
jgi:feruloyl-CoA synthase